ncbi:hypothetical protein C8R44DRAFT_821879 [Mycena epipterygia]|nr:hypothetical protein C8R44DRAFT_821879 [Mycena epipterygia]
MSLPYIPTYTARCFLYHLFCFLEAFVLRRHSPQRFRHFPRRWRRPSTLPRTWDQMPLPWYVVHEFHCLGNSRLRYVAPEIPVLTEGPRYLCTGVGFTNYCVLDKFVSSFGPDPGQTCFLFRYVLWLVSKEGSVS